MDIQKLITMGRLTKTVVYDGIAFEMSTPATDNINDINDNLDLLCVFITKIGDKEFSTPEDKVGLKVVLKQMQGVVVHSLVKKAGEMIEQQTELVEGITKK